MESNTEKYIGFKLKPNDGKKKTGTFEVMNLKQDISVGEIRWYGGWRKYVYYPHADTYYDPRCLELIAIFCRESTKSHMAFRKFEKKAI